MNYEGKIKGTGLMAYSITMFVCVAVAIIACSVVDIAINRAFTWSPIPICSVLFVWLFLVPTYGTMNNKLFATVILFSVLLIPYLLVLDNWLPTNGMFLKIAIPMAIILLVFIWFTFIISMVFKTRKLFAWMVILLGCIPFCLVVRLVLSKILGINVFQIWDVIDYGALLLSAGVLYIIQRFSNNN